MIDYAIVFKDTILLMEHWANPRETYHLANNVTNKHCEFGQ